MEFYFTDRMRQLIATVSTDETDGLMMDGDTETQSLVAGSRTLEGVVHYNADQIDLAKAACAGGNLILYKGRDSEAVVTEIMHVEHSALDMTYTITADSAGVDLLDETVDEYAADDEHDIEFYLTKFIWDSGWTIRKNEVDKSYLKLSWDSDDETALARVLDVADKFGAELDFGFTMGSDGTFEKYIDVYQKRGTATDDELVRDVNINNITTTVDLYDMFTSVKAKADVQDSKNKAITLKGVSYETDDGRYVLGSDGILRDMEAVKEWSRILSVENPDPTVHQLQRVKTYSTGITTLAEDSPTIKQYPQKITAKQKDIASLQKRIKATNGYIAKQKTYITNKETYIKECNARIAKYTAKGQTKYVAAQQGYIANANKSIKGYNTKINEYNAKIKDYNAQITADNADIATMKAGKDLLLTQVQSKLLDMALADLKAHNHPTMTYEVDVAKLPATIRVGDTIHIVDDSSQQFIGARVLELKYSYATGLGEATLGDYVEEQSEISPEMQAIADTLKRQIETKQYYPWVRYADDDQGTNMSALATGKKYMATVWNTDATPSDDPADYAGKWIEMGADGAQGEAGIPGADGRTPYVHTAYATSATGAGFSTTPFDAATYTGTAVTYDDPADPTDPTAYTWVLTRGEKGDTGAAGKDGKDGKDITSFASGPALPETVAPANSQFWVTDTTGQVTAMYLSDGTKWIATPLTASTIAAASFKGYSFEGVSFTGSEFVSTYSLDRSSSPSGEGVTEHHEGELRIGDGLLTGTEELTDNETGDTSTTRLILSPGNGLRFGIGMEDTDANVDITSLPMDEESVTLATNGLSIKESGTEMAYTLTGEMLRQMNSVGNKLWSGTWAMADTTTMTLSKKISECLNGIVLLWGTGTQDKAGSSDYTMTFIPKWFIDGYSGRGIDCFVGNAGQNVVGIKYIYVTNTTLKGYANNTKNEANNKTLQGVYEY